MLPKDKVGGILAVFAKKKGPGEPAGEESYEEELNRCIEEIVTCVEELVKAPGASEKAALADALHQFHDCMVEEDKAADEGEEESE